MSMLTASMMKEEHDHYHDADDMVVRLANCIDFHLLCIVTADDTCYYM